MLKNSAKNKIILLGVAWIVTGAFAFLYFFGILDAANQKTLDALTQQKKDLSVLQAQKQSYAKGKTDLEKLAEQPMQLTDFFSRDITLVNEIKTLEDLSQKTNVKMRLSGISGVVSSEPKANTKTSLFQVPYGVTLYGSFGDITNFIETLEHLSFITDINSLSLNAADKGLVNASFSAHFYIEN